MNAHNISTITEPTDFQLIEKLKSAPFYQVYQNAFRSATGLPLVLVSADEQSFNPCRASENQNPFCREINTGANQCAECVLAQKCALNMATDRAGTTECFAGMKETAVPVKLGNRTVGFMKTGQIFTRKPDDEKMSELESALRKAGREQADIDRLRELIAQTPVISADQYGSMITILSAFALQLAGLVNRILLEGRSSEPETIRRAKAFIMDRIDEKITLEEVADEVNVSTYYFCKIFKGATGMTFTEFVNRQRIEMAKAELLKPERRVTEVAYDVGYQSLSQFNRSFLKIVGESPTQFRKRAGSSREIAMVA
ncbi:MAG: AraC-like DNA-binding protein/ligand-binding sensor protein [Verrucomicrobiales bacterium]|jgi:AraC-like DNA-binding protein/ligand-binding sensor protein